MMRRTALLLLGTAAFVGCAEHEPLQPPSAPVFNAMGAAGPTVMTRNMYLGGDLEPLLTVASPAEIPFVAAAIWAEIQASEFELRAGAMADEIARTGPDLVGLQEVALYRTRGPISTPPATTVAYDFLELLMDALAERGQDYRVVSLVTNSDVEMPVWRNVPPDGLPPISWVRFTDRDVIIARGDVATSNPMANVFAARLTLPLGGAGGPVISQLRGWTSIDATVGGRTFRFVNTHLEVQSIEPIQTAQAAELLAITAASPLPVVMVGDFNSAADGSQTPAYGMFVAAGFRDVWSRGGDPGYTCCQDKTLRNKHSELDQRLDIIFIRGFDTARFTADGQPRIVGHTVGERMRIGLWPSDHAGVVAKLRLPPLQAN
jgi:endonuclease/exonuclease/phosphatase family metal-dependent hydrolase